MQLSCSQNIIFIELLKRNGCVHLIAVVFDAILSRDKEVSWIRTKAEQENMAKSMVVAIISDRLEKSVKGQLSPAHKAEQIANGKQRKNKPLEFKHAI